MYHNLSHLSSIRERYFQSSTTTKNDFATLCTPTMMSASPKSNEANELQIGTSETVTQYVFFLHKLYFRFLFVCLVIVMKSCLTQCLETDFSKTR